MSTHGQAGGFHWLVVPRIATSLSSNRDSFPPIPPTLEQAHDDGATVLRICAWPRHRVSGDLIIGQLNRRSGLVEELDGRIERQQRAGPFLERRDREKQAIDLAGDGAEADFDRLFAHGTVWVDGVSTVRDSFEVLP